MHLGLFPGGFKPFTGGHYARIFLLFDKGCDVIVVPYGLGARDNISAVTAKRLFEHAVHALTATDLRLVAGTPTPIRRAYAIIGAVKDGKDTPAADCAEFGINPNEVSQITLYAGGDDLTRFTAYLGTDREEKYFGDLYRTERLSFISDDEDKLVSMMEEGYLLTPQHARALVNVRGTDVRALIKNGQFEEAAALLPPVYTKVQRDQVIKIIKESSI
jgi:hypothetical protein